MKIHVKVQDKTFEVEVRDINTRPIQVEVDGEPFAVWPEEIVIPSSQQPAPSPAEAVPPVKAAIIQKEAGKKEKSNRVEAPIPGVIIEIKVSEGEKVAYGQELCVLEAMKMKNSIRAGHDGTIAKILVNSSEQVQQGKVLMEFREEAV